MNENHNQTTENQEPEHRESPAQVIGWIAAALALAGGAAYISLT